MKHQLTPFKTFIQTLDVGNKKIERKKRSKFWIDAMQNNKDVKDCLLSWKNKDNFYSLSRNDIFKETDDKNKVIEVLFWGYPSLKESEGRNISDIVNSIIPILNAYKKRKISENDVKSFQNKCTELRLPDGAYSKYLYFFEVHYGNNKPLLIVDRFLKVGIKVFSDFDNCTDEYLSICDRINELSVDLGVDPDKLEYFLFMVGRFLHYQNEDFTQLLNYIVSVRRNKIIKVL